MVSRAYRDALGVERLSDLQRFVAGQHERQHARLLLRGAHQPHALDVGESRCRVVQQRMLVGRDALDTNTSTYRNAPPRLTASAMLPVPASNLFGGP
jgi:hypothetical protein